MREPLLCKYAAIENDARNICIDPTPKVCNALWSSLCFSLLYARQPHHTSFTPWAAGECDVVSRLQKRKKTWLIATYLVTRTSKKQDLSRTDFGKWDKKKKMKRRKLGMMVNCDMNEKTHQGVTLYKEKTWIAELNTRRTCSIVFHK